MSSESSNVILSEFSRRASPRATVTYLSFFTTVTGGNRGIGLALVEQYSTDSNNIIFVGVRDPPKATRVEELAKTAKAKIHLIKIESADEEGNKKAAEEVKKVVGHVDVLLANAGAWKTDVK